MVVKTNKKLAPLKLSGFTCSQSGLVANKTLTKEQWATVGNSLSTIEAKLSWYVGDWLAASKGEAWGYGDLETVCEEFGLNYSSATSAKSVAMAYEMSRRRQNLTFGHHQEVQGRDDADELLDWCEETDPSRTIKDLREEKKRRTKSIAASVPLPKGKFDLILSDPPWQYDFAETDNRKIENQYPTMTLDELSALELPAADDCLLLMWATAPKLFEAFSVISAWGFEYKTHCVWDKEKIGMGYWFRGQHEILMVATKGHVSPPEQSDRVSSVFREGRGKHSAKPACVYEWIEKAFNARAKCEMFCRSPRLGWTVWGNEV
jgi:N6-adenosine-specific RNA methylase IME4